jgi:uncharacterized protein (TIGR01244 family)
MSGVKEHAARLRALFARAVLIGFVAVLPAQQTDKEAIAGATNYRRVEPLFACGGGVTPEAVTQLKQIGFTSIINLRTPDEAGANVPVESAAAKRAGIKLISIPFSARAPNANEQLDRFLEAVADPANRPAYIHCAVGQRAAMMWMIKRVMLDGWSVEKALAEAPSVGLTLANLRQFALDYLKAHDKQ